MWYWHRHTHRLMIQTREPRNKLKYGQIIFDGTQGHLLNKWCCENWLFTCRRIYLDPYLTPYVNINSNCIKDLNVTPKSIKVLVENVEQKLSIIGYGTEFLHITPKAQMTKKMGKLDFMTILTFCISKGTIYRIKRQLPEQEKIFPNHVSVKRLRSRITEKC